MIIGTAGHIDHGKTTLVRALTGVDTDRLPQEKARGISIELGYAYLDVPGEAERIGFIDVPGHERLVHTMLAGATGIDFALLLVAADDGVMPQTREHLAVLSLLDMTRGVVALTKVDRVEPARRDEVSRDIQALLAPTSLSGARVVAVSAQTGEGVDALRSVLFDAARSWATRGGASGHEDTRTFRLAVDRAFTLNGVGTVATGTIHAGIVKVGDEVALTPSKSSLRARVRSLHAQNRTVEEAHAGQRCAVGLAGVAKEDIPRGRWLVGQGDGRGTARLDVRLSLWHAEAKALRSGTPVHVHHGASDVLGSVAVLHGDEPGADSLAPGRSAYVQLVLREPIAACRGDRVVLRDSSSSRSLAGGVVLDPFAPTRYRRTPQRIAELDAWSLDSPGARLDALVAASPHGLSLTRWLVAEGQASASQLSGPDGALQAQDAATGQWLLGAEHATVLADAILGALAAFHASNPDTLGPDAARLRRLVAPRLPEALWRALLARLAGSGRIAQRGAFVHLPEHGIRLSAVDERLAQKIAPLLADAGLEGAWARDLARDTKESEPLMRTTLARLSQGGAIHQVVKDLYVDTATVQRLARIARELAASDDNGDVTAARFRDATNLGRKRAIQVLEYFDRVGLLRRVGDAHRLRPDTALFSEGADA